MDEGGEEGVGGGLAGTQSRGRLVELRQKDRHFRHDPLLFGQRGQREELVPQFRQTQKRLRPAFCAFCESRILCGQQELEQVFVVDSFGAIQDCDILKAELEINVDDGGSCTTSANVCLLYTSPSPRDS